jgi:hypothetical protein
MAAIREKGTIKRFSQEASPGSIEKKGGIAKNFLIFLDFFIRFVSLSYETFSVMALERGYDKSCTLVDTIEFPMWEQHSDRSQ